jgi:hypothetical protein
MMESSQGIAPCMQRFANAPVHLLGRRTKNGILYQGCTCLKIFANRCLTACQQAPIDSSHAAS